MNDLTVLSTAIAAVTTITPTTPSTSARSTSTRQTPPKKRRRTSHSPMIGSQKMQSRNTRIWAGNCGCADPHCTADKFDIDEELLEMELEFNNDSDSDDDGGGEIEEEEKEQASPPLLLHMLLLM